MKSTNKEKSKHINLNLNINININIYKQRWATNDNPLKEHCFPSYRAFGAPGRAQHPLRSRR